MEVEARLAAASVREDDLNGQFAWRGRVAVLLRPERHLKVWHAAPPGLFARLELQFHRLTFRIRGNRMCRENSSRPLPCQMWIGPACCLVRREGNESSVASFRPVGRAMT